MLEPIRLLQNVLWSSTLMMALCFAAIGYLIYRGVKKEEPRTLQICLLFTVLTGVLACMNPILGKLLSRFSGDKYTFIRFTWLLPLFILMAYAATLLIMDLPYKARWIACVLIAGLILCAGEPIPPVYLRAENPYKITDSLKDACDAIHADAGEGRTTVNIYMPDNNIYEDGSVANMRYFGVRQYAPDFILDKTTVNEEQYSKSTFSYEDNLLNCSAYVICDRNEVLYREVEKMGYELLTETEDLAVFKNIAQFTVVFVRHGETEANVAEELVGVFESPLTDKGKKQATAAGKALSGLHFDRAYSSEKERTCDTARLVLDNSGNSDVDVRTMFYLGDINWGVEEGSTWEEIRSKYGADQDLHSIFGAIEDDTFDSPIENADSLYLYNLIYDTNVHKMLTECYVEGVHEGTILLAGHSIAAQWMRQILPTVEVPDGLDNAGVTILRYDGGNWSCVTLNNTDYEEVAEIVGTL